MSDKSLDSNQLKEIVQVYNNRLAANGKSIDNEACSSIFSQIVDYFSVRKKSISNKTKIAITLHFYCIKHNINLNKDKIAELVDCTSYFFSFLRFYNDVFKIKETLNKLQLIFDIFDVVDDDIFFDLFDKLFKTFQNKVPVNIIVANALNYFNFNYQKSLSDIQILKLTDCGYGNLDSLELSFKDFNL